jgi:hypothetical protein
MFPIVFAAVVGRAAKQFANWRLEHGVSLGLLEQLMGSCTFFGTISTQFLLHSFNLLGVGLILLWALSPLGGQSSLHVISTAYEPVFSNSSIKYLNSRASPAFTDSGDLSRLELPLNALYSSSLLAPVTVTNSSMDLWGNVKIPILSRLSTDADSEGWKKVPATTDVGYSSLMGIPTAYIPRSHNTSFNVESSYWDIDCYDINYGHLIALNNSMDHYMNGEQVSGLDSEITPLEQNSSYVGSNGTESCSSQDYFCSLSLGISNVVPGIDMGTPETVAESGIHALSRTKPTILFQFPYFDEGLFNVTRAFCHISQIYVESAVSCSFPESAAHPNCTVSSIRESIADHPPPYITDLSFGAVIQNWASSLAASYGAQLASEMGYTAIQGYLMNAPLGFIPDDTEGAGTNPMLNTPASTFSERLSHVLNTYWLGSIFPQAMTGDFASLPANTNASGDMSDPPLALHTQAQLSTLKEIYTCNWAWLGVYSLASSVLLIAAILGVVLNHLIFMPDILAACSSLTRDNPFVRVPRGGSTLSGFERSRLLKEMRVRLGDVRNADSAVAESGVGYLAFANDEDIDRIERRVAKRRRYA